MKLKNEIIVICLICVILISISSVYAEDNNTNIITENNNVYDDLSLNNENEILSDNTGNFEELNNIVNGGSSTVELNRNYSYSSPFNEGKGIVISQNNITIDGKGHTIDANGNSRIFNVTGTTVTLKNIIFINGYSEGSSGGAVYGYGDNLRVLNCTFINNTASRWGGAVYSYPDSYSVFYNSRFINNSAVYGGGLATIYGYRQDVLNCVFDSNNATWGGGLLIYGQLATTNRTWDDNVNIRGCQFENNKASNGSAICNYLSAYVNMTNSIILGEQTTLIDSWGAMFFADFNWWGNTYDNRSVRPKIDKNVQFGNWLYLDVILSSTDSNLTVSINNLYDESSASASIHSASNLPSIIVYLNATNATVKANNISLGKNGVCKVPYSLGEMASITASYEDIAVTKSFNFGSFRELQEIIRNARNNTIITLDRDYVYSAEDTITQGIVISNKNNITIDGKGHTVNALGNSRVFGVSVTSRDIVIKNLKIVNGNRNGSRESDFGAGMIWESPNGRLINCTFANNYANGLQGGGALYWSGNNGYLIDCAFINNTHEHSVGGAVYWYGTGAHIVHTVFENNTAKAVEGSGGALYLIHGGANIMDCNFTNNRAKYGGAINDYSFDNVASHITNCIFKGNVATTTDSDMGGGAICANDVSITNSIFIENKASNGAAVYCLYEMGNIEECVFINNTATLNGIVFWGTGGNIKNSIFLNNNVSYGRILISIFGGLDADDNWFGNVWKDHNWEPNVDNRANMTKWLFLNATEPVYDEASGSFTTGFTFLEYDSTTQTTRSYGIAKLPHFTLELSSQNLTLKKYNVELEESIEATTTYFMGNLVAEYENVRYLLPFKYQKRSWIEANQSVIKNIGKSSYLSYTVRPFQEDVTPFLTKYLTFESSDKSVVRVDSQGKITTIKAGTANITIKYSGKNLKGDYEYLPSNITITVNVIRTPTYIEMIYFEDSVNVGQSGNFIASTRPGGASGGVTYSCNDTQILRLDSSGYYKALKSGTVNVTVSYAGNANYEPSQLSFIVKVNRKPTSIDYESGQVINLDLNSQYQFYTYLNPSGVGELKCLSNDTGIATAEYVNGALSLTGTGVGLAKVTLYFEGNDEYEPSSVDVLVNVTGTETKINVNETMTLYLNNIGYIPYTVSPYNIFNLVFTSNDTSVIRFLDNYGQYETVGNGVANVTIDLVAHGKYLPSSANIIVTVKSVETNILVNSTFDLYVGQTKNMAAKLNPKVGDLTYASNDTSVVNVTKTGYLNAMKEGTAKITVTYAGGNGFLPSNATVIVTVKKGSTRIEIDDEIEIYNKRYGYLNAKLISEWQNTQISGLEYASNDTDTLTINGYGFMTAKKLGEVEITINYNGSDKYLPTSKKILVRVILAPTEINVSSEIVLLMDETDNLNATLNPDVGQLNYTSNDSNVVTVDDSGNIVAVGLGKASITITYDGNDRYAPANKTVLVEIVGSKVHTNIIANETIDVYVGNSTNIGAAINPISALVNGKLIYSVENPEIIEIDENGNVKGLKVGNTTVTISYNENSRFLSNSTIVKVNVLIIPSEIDAADSISLNLSESTNIDAKLIKPVEGQLIYSSSDLEIVSVDENGVITAHKVGNATITVTYLGNENYTASSKTVKVRVTAVPTAIEVNDYAEVNLTEKYRINAKLTPYAKGKLNYASTDTGIATVDENGIITGVGVGEAYIIVSFEGEGKYLPNSIRVHVNVTAVETSIDVADSLDVNKTEIMSIGGVVIPYAKGKITYESTNTSIVTVSAYGWITAKEFGEADIIVRFAGEGKYLPSSAKVHIRVVGVESSIIADEYIEANAGTQGRISASLVPNSNGKLTFTSNDSSIISITENGRYNAVRIGLANITIAYAGEGKYLPATKSVLIRVCGLNATINVADNISANPLDSFKLNATLTPAVGKLNYESNDTEIVTVDENGTLHIHKEGLATVTVSFSGNNEYLPVNRTVKVNSTRLTPQITFLDSDIIDINGTKGVMQVGLSGMLNYELNYRQLRNNLTYLSSDSEIVSIENGFIQAVGGGNAEITVSYAGNERYAPFSEKLTITVNKRVTYIKVNNNITLSVEDIFNLDARLVDKYGFDLGGTLEYSVDNPSVITLNDGKITALKKGTAVITIRFNETIASTAATAKVNVSVIAKATKITLNRENIYLDVFENTTVTATLDDPEDGEITFKSSDETVATVDRNGKITAVGHGAATITASYAGCDDYLPSSANVTVRVTALQTIINVVGFAPLIKGNTIDLNATLTPNVGNLVYSSGDSNILYVDDETGKVTGLNTGTTFVNIEFKGNKQYSRSIKQVTVQVILDSTSITVNDHQSLEVGHRMSINATLNPHEAGYLIYSSNDERIAAIDSNGIIQARSEGMTIITVKFEGNQQYIACERTVTVYVNKDSSSVNFQANVKEDSRDTTFSINLPSDADGTFTVLVDGKEYQTKTLVNGKATINVDGLAPGDHKIILKYSGDDRYAATTQEKTIHITDVRFDKNTDVTAMFTTQARYTVQLKIDTQVFEGKTVTFKVNGNAYYVKTDRLGYAFIDLKLPAGKYVVTAEYNGVKVTNTVTFKHIIVAKNLKLKKSASSKKIKIKLNKVNNKILKGKKVTLKFKGKKYKAKTNKKGIAKFTLKKSAYSKLKVGKKYKYTVTYAKDKVTKKIKIQK